MYSTSTRYIHLESREPRSGEVHKYWRVDPGRDRVDCIIFHETARHESRYVHRRPLPFCV